MLGHYTTAPCVSIFNFDEHPVRLYDNIRQTLGCQALSALILGTPAFF
jgi:hypothetical protein